MRVFERWFNRTLAYWKQRADFSSTEFPPATLREAVAALHTHDWGKELELMREREAAEQEFCMPGMGLTLGKGCFLHICPNVNGTATCFYAGEGNSQRGSLHRDDVSRKEQARLIKLFYKQAWQKLARAFGEQDTRSGKWPERVEALYDFVRPLAITVGVIFVVICAIMLLITILEGVPFFEAVGRLISGMPYMLLIHVIMLGGIVLMFGPILLVMLLFEKKGRALRIEGQDQTYIILMGCGFLVLFAILGVFSGQWSEFVIHVGRLAGFVGAFLWPIYAMGKFHRRQDRILDKIRSHYVISITALMAGHDALARARLNSIRRLEAHWHLGASAPVRVAHVGYVAMATFGIAFGGQVLAYHSGSHVKSRGLSDSIVYLLNETTWGLAFLGGVALLFSLIGLRDAMQVRSKPWAEFYGDQLAAALRAGRGVENAPQHELPPLPEGVTARELLGLNATFTKAELRSAWRRLAKELHPDRWMQSGEAVRRTKETALKRVNKARDELAPLAM
jgi:hypothetical protein